MKWWFSDSENNNDSTSNSSNFSNASNNNIINESKNNVNNDIIDVNTADLLPEMSDEDLLNHPLLLFFKTFYINKQYIFSFLFDPELIAGLKFHNPSNLSLNKHFDLLYFESQNGSLIFKSRLDIFSSCTDCLLLKYDKLARYGDPKGILNNKNYY